jgi:type II secretory pathway pseudopilin PulG
MVELVIVVMIMSIMTAVAAPAFFESLLYHRVESAAHRLKADLELARHTARLKSAAQTITFTAGTYTFSAGVKGFDAPSGIYSVALGGPPFELDSVIANFGGTNVLTFDGYGKPNSGGTVVLALQGHQCTLTVNGTTGDVSITSLHTRGNAPQYGN